MNSTKSQSNERAAQCCIDYCITPFEVAGEAFVNTYRCGQRTLSVADVWNIQKNRKTVERREGI